MHLACIYYNVSIMFFSNVSLCIIRFSHYGYIQVKMFYTCNLHIKVFNPTAEAIIGEA